MSNTTVTTTNHNEKILYFVQTILSLPQNSFADLTVWNFIGERSTTTFREFINNVRSEQEMEDTGYNPNINNTLRKRAQGQYNKLLKGVRYAKHRKKNGLPHWDDPTQWDVGDFQDTDMETLDGLPLVTPRAGAASSGGTKTVILNASKTEEQKALVEFGNKHGDDKRDNNHRLMILSDSQENNNLGSNDTILQKRRKVTGDINMTTDCTILVQDIPVLTTTDLVNCSGPHEHRAADGYTTYFSKATEEGNIRENQNVRGQLDNSIEWSILQLSSVLASTPKLSDQSDDDPIVPGIIDDDISILSVPTGDRAINNDGIGTTTTSSSLKALDGNSDQFQSGGSAQLFPVFHATLLNTDPEREWMKLLVPCIELGNYDDILLLHIHMRVQSLTDVYSFVLIQPSPCAQYLSPDEGIHIHLHLCDTVTTSGMLINDFGHIVNWHLHSETYCDEFWSCTDRGGVVCSTVPPIESPTASNIANDKSFTVFVFELDHLNCNDPTIHFCYPGPDSTD